MTSHKKSCNVDLDLLSEQWNDFHTGLTNKQKFNWDPPKNPVFWVICVVVFNFSRLVRFTRDWAQFKLNIIEVELGIESFDKRWNERWYLCLFPVGCQCKLKELWFKLISIQQWDRQRRVFSLSVFAKETRKSLY